MSHLGSLVCKCLFIFTKPRYHFFADKSGYIPTHHSKCTIFESWSSVPMAYWYLFSWSALVLAIIIWSLVFYFISFWVYLTFVKATLIILKHASLLHLSNISPKLALIRAELEYQQADIDSKIDEYLMMHSQAQGIELFAGFIMTTDIGQFFFTSLKIISYQAFSPTSVFGSITCACKWCYLKNVVAIIWTLSLLSSSYSHLVVLILILSSVPFVPWPSHYYYHMSTCYLCFDPRRSILECYLCVW